MKQDKQTADAFATSWNNLPKGSVYTKQQFYDWINPLTESDFIESRVLELGCGNGSLMIHAAKWKPKFIQGIDLGESVKSAYDNLKSIENIEIKIEQEDLTEFDSSEKFDICYCIGVLHHLENPVAGFNAVIRNIKKGGKFHCWVYAYEGNELIRLFVEPLRKTFSHFPWWFTKYFVATPLVIPYFIYANVLKFFYKNPFAKKFPLYKYSLWIAKNDFNFFRHVAFDQLVTPHTVYIKKQEIQNWINNNNEIDISSVYLIFRNGNSWKFGGRKKIN